ncbi:ribosomal protein S18 acetylase RimI-like enzyme [Streptomyces olivoverticillatus]|uniref:Ribosomal protein S18 acetylase RimI-like enzyme n=1 Tax=Streptomyces olivoverticillatus TaxID=66427 RepID=A0A7W7PNH4_9ACTN|nr:GNAT family N-acetyltransferase [Streptomyces olivoverticillatus]MBB4895518.1 ribosomal protein S18 acetylase RimI-like enzyme [Streptomyces olivoverticillatus]
MRQFGTRIQTETQTPAHVVTVRQADEGDLDFFVWAMITAATSHLSRSCWEVLFGAPVEVATEVLRALARSPRPHWCHLSRCRVAEVDGTPAGALTVFDPAAEGIDALAGEFAALTAAENGGPGAGVFPGMPARQAVFASCVPGDYAGAWGIENVAVLPSFRGAGVVDALLGHALDLGRARGREHAQVMCLDGNVRAQRAWERNGFEVRADYRGRDFEALFGCRGLKLLVQAY